VPPQGPSHPLTFLLSQPGFGPAMAMPSVPGYLREEEEHKPDP